MAHHKSAQKRIRQTETRTAVNRSRMTQVRSAVKSVEAAIATKNKANAQTALKSAQSIIMSGVSKGVIKLATASRKVSRLSARIKAIA